VKPFLFLCGNIRRDELPDTLKAANIKLEEVTTYETHQGVQTEQDWKLKPAADGRRLWAVVFSPSGVQCLSQVYRTDEWQSVRLARNLVLSKLEHY